MKLFRKKRHDRHAQDVGQQLEQLNRKILTASTPEERERLIREKYDLFRKMKADAVEVEAEKPEDVSLSLVDDSAEIRAGDPC